MDDKSFHYSYFRKDVVFLNQQSSIGQFKMIQIRMFVFLGPSPKELLSGGCYHPPASLLDDGDQSGITSSGNKEVVAATFRLHKLHFRPAKRGGGYRN